MVVEYFTTLFKYPRPQVRCDREAVRLRVEDGQDVVRNLQAAGLKVQGRHEPAGELPVHQEAQGLLLAGRKRTGGASYVSKNGISWNLGLREEPFSAAR